MSPAIYTYMSLSVPRARALGLSEGMCGDEAKWQRFDYPGCVPQVDEAIQVLKQHNALPEVTFPSHPNLITPLRE